MHNPLHAAPAWVQAAVAISTAAFVVLYFKGLPFVWHLRFFSLIVWEMAFGKRLRRLDEKVVFHDRVWLSDMDFNLHMNNAHYNVSADFARFRWYCKFYGSYAAFRAHRAHNGGVSIYFLKELAFLEPFTVEVTLAGFDGKWGFLHLAYVGTRTGMLHAVGVSRFVAKYPSRKTIPPKDLFGTLGYEIPPAVAARSSFEKLNAELEAELRASVHHHGLAPKS